MLVMLKVKQVKFSQLESPVMCDTLKSGIAKDLSECGKIVNTICWYKNTESSADISKALMEDIIIQ